MAYTATSDVAGFIPKYYSKLFLERLQPGPKMLQFCEMKPLPQNSGTVAYFPRMVVDSTVVSAYKLAEGTVITPDKIDDAQVSATIEQFGRSAGITDLTEMTAINGVVEEAVRALGDQANNIIDLRIIEACYGVSASAGLDAPTGATGALSCIAFNTVAGAEGGAMSAYGTYTGTTEFRMKASTVRYAVGKLMDANVKPFDDGFYALVVKSNTAMRLQADSEWQTALTQTGKLEVQDKSSLINGESPNVKSWVTLSKQAIAVQLQRLSEKTLSWIGMRQSALIGNYEVLQKCRYIT